MNYSLPVIRLVLLISCFVLGVLQIATGLNIWLKLTVICFTMRFGMTLKMETTEDVILFSAFIFPPSTLSAPYSVPGLRWNRIYKKRISLHWKLLLYLSSCPWSIEQLYTIRLLKCPSFIICISGNAGQCTLGLGHGCRL